MLREHFDQNNEKGMQKQMLEMGGKTCFENIKTKQGCAGRLISWDIYFPRFRFAVGFTRTII